MAKFRHPQTGALYVVPDEGQAAEILRRAGWQSAEAALEGPEHEEGNPVTDLTALTKRELREYAAEQGIDLTGVRDTKDALLAAIAEAGDETEDDEPDEDEEAE